MSDSVDNLTSSLTSNPYLLLEMTNLGITKVWVQEISLLYGQTFLETVYLTLANPSVQIAW